MSNANTPCDQSAESTKSAETGSTVPASTPSGHLAPSRTCIDPAPATGDASPNHSTTQTMPSAPPAITPFECNQLRATLLAHRIMAHRMHQRCELNRRELDGLIDDIDQCGAIIDRLASAEQAVTKEPTADDLEWLDIPRCLRRFPD